MSSDATLPDSDFVKEVVYLVYRDIFKGNLAKLRKPSRVRSVVETHKYHLYPKQLADVMDSEKTCRILGDLLSARLFESDSAARATFPALFSPAKSGNDTVLTAMCVADDFEGCEQRNRINPDAIPFPDILRSFDTPMPNEASLGIAPAVQQHRIDIKSGRIKKPTRAMRRSMRAIRQVGEGNEAVPKDVLREGINRSLPRWEEGNNFSKPTRDCINVPTNATYLPFRLQHLVLAQTQRLLEECCYHFAEKWFPSILVTNGWDAPEAVEITRCWKTLSNRDIPVTAIALSHEQSLAVLFKRAIAIRNHAVHRVPRISVEKVEEMVRDALLLSQVLQDDFRAAELLKLHKELKTLVAHLQLRTNSQREAAEAELRNIDNAKVELQARLAELESRESQLTLSLELEGGTHRPIDVEALRPLEEALNKPALAKALLAISQDEAWQWIDSSAGMIIDLRHAGVSQKLTVKIEPPSPIPRDQPLLGTPILNVNTLHGCQESFYGYMGERAPSHDRQCSREADGTEQEVFQGLANECRVTTRSMKLPRTAVQGRESSRLTPGMQKNAKNEAAGCLRPRDENELQSASAEQLEPSPRIWYLPDPVPIDDGNESTDYEWD